MSTSSTDGTAGDVLTILGARSPADVRIRTSQGIVIAYAFEVVLANAPDFALPIDVSTANVLLAQGARRA